MEENKNIRFVESIVIISCILAVISLIVIQVVLIAGWI